MFAPAAVDVELPEDAEIALDRLTKQKGVSAVVLTDAAGTAQRAMGDADACKRLPAAVAPVVTLARAMLRELDGQHLDLLRIRGAGVEVAVVPGDDFVLASVQSGSAE